MRELHAVAIFALALVVLMLGLYALVHYTPTQQQRCPPPAPIEDLWPPQGRVEGAA